MSMYRALRGSSVWIRWELGESHTILLDATLS